MNLTDKIAIITGGSRGIGKAICQRFGEEGATVIIVNVNSSAGRATAEELKTMGFQADNIAADISDEKETAELAKSVIKKFGKIDILVNNAGIAKDNLVLRMKTHDWNQVLDVNLRGTFNCIKAVGRHMVKARYGKIINISSVVGLSGNTGQANYAASKAGIIGLSKSVAKEFASRNINVNVVAPGYITTEMTDQLDGDAKSSFLRNIPFHRPGVPREVANLVCFLATDEAAYITGQTINVDGGMLMY